MVVPVIQTRGTLFDYLDHNGYLQANSGGAQSSDILLLVHPKLDVNGRVMIPPKPVDKAVFNMTLEPGAPTKPVQPHVLCCDASLMNPNCRDDQKAKCRVQVWSAGRWSDPDAATDLTNQLVKFIRPSFHNRASLALHIDAANNCTPYQARVLETGITWYNPDQRDRQSLTRAQNTNNNNQDQKPRFLKPLARDLLDLHAWSNLVEFTIRGPMLMHLTNTVIAAIKEMCAGIRADTQPPHSPLVAKLLSFIENKEPTPLILWDPCAGLASHKAAIVANELAESATDFCISSHATDVIPLLRHVEGLPIPHNLFAASETEISSDPLLRSYIDGLVPYAMPTKDGLLNMTEIRLPAIIHTSLPVQQKNRFVSQLNQSHTVVAAEILMFQSDPIDEAVLTHLEQIGEDVIIPRHSAVLPGKSTYQSLDGIVIQRLFINKQLMHTIKQQNILATSKINATQIFIDALNGLEMLTNSEVATFSALNEHRSSVVPESDKQVVTEAASVPGTQHISSSISQSKSGSECSSFSDSDSDSDAGALSKRARIQSASDAKKVKWAEPVSDQDGSSDPNLNSENATQPNSELQRSNATPVCEQRISQRHSSKVPSDNTRGPLSSPVVRNKSVHLQQCRAHLPSHRSKKLGRARMLPTL